MTHHEPTAHAAPVATYKKICVDARSPTHAGPHLADRLGLEWRADDSGEGGIVDASGRYLVWCNEVADVAVKSDRVRLDVDDGAAPGHRLRGLVVEAVDPRSQARWWSGLYGVAAAPAGDGSWTVPEVPGMPCPLTFVPAIEPKDAPNRVHWDIRVADVRLLVEAGATMLRPMGGNIAWHVVADPEGNEMCAFLT